MPEWLMGVMNGLAAVLAVILLILLGVELILRRELRRRSERDDEIWYTTGSPMVWTQDLANHLED